MNSGMFFPPSEEALIQDSVDFLQSFCGRGYRDPIAPDAAAALANFDVYLYWVEDLMNRGMEAFRVHDYTAAAGFFKTVLDIQKRRYGDPVSCQVYLRYSLALLYETPLWDGDSLFYVLPMEADYLLCSDPKFVDAGDHMDGVSSEQFCAERYKEREQLILTPIFDAWSIAGGQPKSTLEKVDIMCAFGEATFRLGTGSGKIYYECALCMMKDLIANRSIERTDLRRAHIYFKISLGFERSCFNTEKAIQYCELAINVCQERIHKLGEESNGCYERREEDVQLATKFCNLFEKKLENMRNSIIPQNGKSNQAEVSPDRFRLFHWTKKLELKVRKTIFNCLSNMRMNC